MDKEKVASITGAVTVIAVVLIICLTIVISIGNASNYFLNSQLDCREVTVPMGGFVRNSDCATNTTSPLTSTISLQEEKLSKAKNVQNNSSSIQDTNTTSQDSRNSAIDNKHSNSITGTWSLSGYTQGNYASSEIEFRPDKTFTSVGSISLSGTNVPFRTSGSYTSFNGTILLLTNNGIETFYLLESTKPSSFVAVNPNSMEYYKLSRII